MTKDTTNDAVSAFSSNSSSSGLTATKNEAIIMAKSNEPCSKTAGRMDLP
eukprot:CAMPEP_0197732016 /NCGR_PEP_ID=MMETSP1434-20131217/39322_1 /TAXON_ID=265543 /ORGANISM="Minutocellus polymorphus, Strain CCMP3303" /LENGTH=49 /DNA_ID= /DNA_START= /DNA_END= /DNA_ORIENTATION=